MIVQVQINNSTSPAAQFLTWAPSPCRIRMTNPSGATRADGQRQALQRVGRGRRRGRISRRPHGSVRQHAHPDGPDERHQRSVLHGRQFGRPSSQQWRRQDRSASRQPRWSARSRCMVRIRKNANTPDSRPRRDRFVAAFAQLNNQGLGRFRGLPRHAHATVTLAAGARRARVPAVASRLPARSRARASGDRPERRAALLALRPGRRPNIFTARLPRACPTTLGTVHVQPTATRCSSGRPTACRGSIAGRSSTSRSAPPGLLHRGADAWRSGTQYRQFRDHGRQSARIGAYQLWRLRSRASATAAQRSAVLPAPLQRRPAVGEVAAPERPLRSGARRVVSTTASQARSATICRTRCGRGTA